MKEPFFDVVVASNPTSSTEMELAEVNNEDQLRASIMVADSLRMSLFEQKNWNQLLIAFEYLTTIKKDLDVLIKSVESDIATLLPAKKVVVPGMGVVEQSVTSTKKWESESLLNVICRDTLDPNRTGEVEIENVLNLIEILKKVLPFTPSMGWRSTALKEMGIDPSSYSDTTWGRKTIRIIK